jgi:pimeloyl-ACP methyl ester carboxylesterase
MAVKFLAICLMEILMIPKLRVCALMLMLSGLVFQIDVLIAGKPELSRESGPPPAMHELVIDSGGKRMAALAYVAAGAGPHPTVILLHGYPGNEKNLDLAQAIRRSGWNVLFFHYRGAWGSEGDFSLVNAEADVQSAIDFLRTRETAGLLRVNTNRIALVGHSMGGHMALAGLTADAGVVCAVSLDGANMGVLAPAASADPEAFAGFKAYTDGLFMLHGWDGEALQEMLIEHGEALDLVPRMALAGQRPVLFLMADSTDVPVDVHARPLTAALEASGNHNWVLEIIRDDHSFSASRQVLAARVNSFLAERCHARPARADTLAREG